MPYYREMSFIIWLHRKVPLRWLCQSGKQDKWSCQSLRPSQHFILSCLKKKSLYLKCVFYFTISYGWDGKMGDGVGRVQTEPLLGIPEALCSLWMFSCHCWYLVNTKKACLSRCFVLELWKFTKQHPDLILLNCIWVKYDSLLLQFCKWNDSTGSVCSKKEKEKDTFWKKCAGSHWSSSHPLRCAGDSGMRGSWWSPDLWQPQASTPNVCQDSHP